MVFINIKIILIDIDVKIKIQDFVVSLLFLTLYILDYFTIFLILLNWFHIMTTF
jgi:hypothetical protein